MDDQFVLIEERTVEEQEALRLLSYFVPVSVVAAQHITLSDNIYTTLIPALLEAGVNTGNQFEGIVRKNFEYIYLMTIRSKEPELELRAIELHGVNNAALNEQQRKDKNEYYTKGPRKAKRLVAELKRLLYVDYFIDTPPQKVATPSRRRGAALGSESVNNTPSEGIFFIKLKQYVLTIVMYSNYSRCCRRPYC